MKIFLLLIIFTSCSLFSSKDERILEFDENFKLENKITDTHFNIIIENFLKHNDYTKISGSDRKYLNNIVDTMVSENELLFGRKKILPNYYILNDDRPLFFSFPSGDIFMSNGLLSKFLKHESILAIILANQIIRIEKNIFMNKSVFPVGYYNVNDLIKLSRIPLSAKSELHKWSFYVVSRSGFDEGLYLTWLQLMNRNNNLFSVLSEKENDLVYEESIFKTFVVTYTKGINTSKQLTSSKQFYNFINKYGLKK